MAAAARARGISCEVGQAASGLSFADRSFDLVCAAYVAHGLERSDYRGFIRTACSEMREVFGKVRVVPVTGKLSWYVCG